jgi:L-rhamnonate dehydratase
MNITAVNLFTIHSTWPGDEYPVGNRQIKSSDRYADPDTNLASQDAQPIASGTPISDIFVEVVAGDISGIYGPINREQAFVIADSLRPFLIGQDALATEKLYDQMIRMNRHGRSGLFMMGVSVIDCALWDLRGKVLGLPVYRLLGGPTRSTIPVYASMLGYSTDPDDASQVARDYVEQGYIAQKWFFRFGPAHGTVGKQKNIRLAQALRDTVGEYYPLMFDAFMGWDVTYAIEMAKTLADLNITWLEEPIPPERVDAFRQIRTMGGVPIATGEHVYTRWQVKELLVNDAVDYIQADPDWTGGITEQLKICALGSAFEVPVIAHGHSLLPPLHIAAAQSPATVPYVEYLMRYQPRKQFFQANIYTPQQGYLTLPDLPGLGLVLDDNKIERREQLFE